MGRKSKFDSAFKTKVVPDALREKETLSALLGRQSCSMLCFTDLPLASRFAAAMADEAPQWGDTAALLARREEKAARRKAAPRKAQRGGP